MSLVVQSINLDYINSNRDKFNSNNKNNIYFRYVE